MRRIRHLVSTASVFALAIGTVAAAPAFAVDTDGNQEIANISENLDGESETGSESDSPGVGQARSVGQAQPADETQRAVESDELEEPAELTEINLLNINDFHGRIDGTLEGKGEGEVPYLSSSSTVDFAWTVESLKSEYGAENSLFLSAGDNVGASLFASSIQADEPTIELLNTLGLEATAVGNHEFDAGWDDIARLKEDFDAVLLGANVYLKGTDDPAFHEYYLTDVAGVSVAVIGVVTQETPTLVSPDNVSDLDFGDPVAAVNRVAAELTEAGIADVIIAEYHEGAGGVSPTTSIEDAMAASPVFTKIVNETSPEVDAIFTGHTHNEYAWDAPIPGEEDKTRPIMQTGNYGQNVGQVVLNVNSDGDVESYTQELVSTSKDLPTLEEMLEDPTVEQAYDIVLAAMVEADQQGSVVTGELTAPVTRPYTDGTFTNGAWAVAANGEATRDSTSAMGNLVADALQASVAELAEPADLGIVNPGGLRDDLYPAANGDITVAQARSVLPFNNELSIVTLTGAQLQSILEEQWQRDENGEVPSRPYLQLGLSSNFSYTFTEIAEPGATDGRTAGVINSMTLNGEPVDPDAEYRVATFAFLAAGGDNFLTFTDGTEVNTGFLDWESWLQYLEEASPISPSFEQPAVSTEGLSGAKWKTGETAKVTVGNLNVYSAGSPEVTSVDVTVGGQSVGSFPVSEGVASIEFTVPAGLDGTVDFEAVAAATGTTVTVPVEVTEAEVAGPTLSLGATKVAAGGEITVSGEGWTPETAVTVELHSDPVVLAKDVAVNSAGAFSQKVTIPADTAAGEHTLVVTNGTETVSVKVTVTAATSGGSGDNGESADTAETSDDGELAKTGANGIVWILVAAGVLGVAGVAGVRVAGRRA